MAAMAQTLPGGLRGRMLALGVTALLLCAVWLGVVQPLADRYDSGAAALRQKRELAGRMADLAATLPVLHRQAAAVASAGPPTAATLSGASDAIAAASLQGLVESMTGAAGAHLTSAEALPAEQQGAYRRIALRVSVDAHWATLIALLQAIGHATPKMFVDELQLHAQPSAEKVREQPLDIAFTVLAFRAATSAGGAAVGADAAGDSGDGMNADQGQ